MIKNFDVLKGQLKELASVINGFKSEAVQLRIVELIFQGAEVSPDEKENSGDAGKSTPKRKTTKKKSKVTKKTAGKKTTRKGKPGPASILDELIGDGFFNKPKTINEIITHCSSQKARILKANELSTPLARFVRNKKLKRDKNSDGQYQYQNA